MHVFSAREHCERGRIFDDGKWDYAFCLKQVKNLTVAGERKLSDEQSGIEKVVNKRKSHLTISQIQHMDSIR